MRSGIEVDHAVSGEEALRLHAAEPYRDRRSLTGFFRVIDGIELCRRLRALARPLRLRAPLQRPRRPGQAPGGLRRRGRRLSGQAAGAATNFGRGSPSPGRILAGEDRAAAQLDEMRGGRVPPQMAHLNENLKLASRRFEDLFDGLPVACFTFDAEGLRPRMEPSRRSKRSEWPVSTPLTRSRVWETLGGGRGAVEPSELCARHLHRGDPRASSTGPAPRPGRRTGVHLPCHRPARPGRAGGGRRVRERGRDRPQARRADARSRRRRAWRTRTRVSTSWRPRTVSPNLWNRRSFMSEPRIRARRVPPRWASPFSLVLLDIDKFQDSTTTRSAIPPGDEVLRRFARVLRGAAPRGRPSIPPATAVRSSPSCSRTPGAAKGLAAAERFRKRRRRRGLGGARRDLQPGRRDGGSRTARPPRRSSPPPTPPSTPARPPGETVAPTRAASIRNRSRRRRSSGLPLSKWIVLGSAEGGDARAWRVSVGVASQAERGLGERRLIVADSMPSNRDAGCPL